MVKCKILQTKIIKRNFLESNENSNEKAEQETEMAINKAAIDYDFGATEKMSKLDQLKECLKSQIYSTLSPSLKGSKNTLIDLDTGNILPENKSGPEELFERFLKHSTKNTKKKPKNVR